MTEQEKFVGAMIGSIDARRTRQAAAVTQIREGMDQMDREYRVNLAVIRQAADLTQVELAQKGGSQASRRQQS